jgi:uncharacterized protein YndB with AHSA1/START domain
MITKTVRLACSSEKAFALFTEHASEWWPASRRHTQDVESSIRMVAGGRFWEQGRDGREVELGRVRIWDPPRRLVLDFFVGTDAEHPTEVTATFEPEGDGTRVTIDHRPTPASELLWRSRASVFEQSWTQVLEALAGAASPLAH